MSLEARYYVIKLNDLHAAHSEGFITQEQITALIKIDKTLEDFRQKNGKQKFGCVVVENDWPIYQETVDRILGADNCKHTSEHWISVEEKLPEHRQKIIVACKDGCVYEDIYDEEEKLWINCRASPVTHWQPLPTPPKTE